jgi:heptosyltransferase-2
VSANVLIQTAFLGDLLLSIPLMKKMKTLWPEQKLILICRKGIGEFFTKTQLVDEVFEIKKGDSPSYKQIIKTLKRREIERIISPHESVRTAFFVQKIKAKEKISFAKPWNQIFYGQRIPKNDSLPDAIRQLSLLQNCDENLKKQIQTFLREETPYQVKAKGPLSAAPAWATMSLKRHYQQHSQELPALLQKLKLSSDELARSVAIFPGSVWATKRWMEEGYIQLGQNLRSQNIPVLVMGGPGEEELCAKITAQIPGARDLCAKTSIYESAMLLSQIAAVVGNDSASMHLAATGETPSVVIFGPTVLEFGFRPWQDHVYVVERHGLECRPCGKHGHKVCPIKTHVCMTSIHKEEVLEKLEEILK